MKGAAVLVDLKVRVNELSDGDHKNVETLSIR